MTIRILTKDGHIFDVDKKLLMKSKLMKDLIDDVGNEEAENNIPFPLIYVSSRALEKVILWCQHYEEPIDESNSLYISVWDENFFNNMESEIMVDLLIAADYLDIPDLYEKCSQFCAKILTSNSVEELRKIFGIECDLSFDELQRINDENEYFGRM
ncbi:unnamed protein product [Hymenolepis diminuta]|uniref:SKP1-like protein n=1 Tax=Hymenolepis diminuta TaxID=6216 RepID=A0A0R3STF6_HYMDI|nr:unnamed protein product [Hymenolepis diminuta]VUZ57246.1 unnamed protein product [Hymenolepis diminuta]